MATDCLEKRPIRLKEPIEKFNYNRETGEEYITWITEISVPCGKCARCLQRRKMEWSFRMLTELQEAKTAYFVTLTYAPETVPYNQYGLKDLRIDHLQKYFKRLRINTNRRNKAGNLTIENLRNNLTENDKIKYYAAGEYGEKNGRPHYHAVIFNASAIEIKYAWPHGSVDIAEANEATINYLMKYLDKRLGTKPDKRKTPEFNTMSEGLGKSYVKKMKEWHKQNLDVLYVRMKNGILVPMPRYLRKMIFTEQEMKHQVILVEDILKEIKEEQVQEYGTQRYGEIQSETKKESDRRFKKKIKKRIVD